MVRSESVLELTSRLYAKGQEAEARKVLAYFHSRDNDINSPLIELEMQEIIAQISQDGGDKRWWDFRALFNTRANTYRFMLGVANLFGSQFAGNGAITSEPLSRCAVLMCLDWLPVCLLNAGITSLSKQRVYTFANSITSMTGAMIGTWIVDHVGRRPLQLFGAGACGINMAICAGLLSKTTGVSQARNSAGIAFLSTSRLNAMRLLLTIRSVAHGLVLHRLDPVAISISL